MRAVNEIEKALSGVNESLNAARKRLQEKETELAAAVEANKRLTKETLHRERLPQSLSVQRNTIAALQLEIDQLKSIVADYEAEAAGIHAELADASAVEEAVPRARAYWESVKSFDEGILAAMGTLRQMVDMSEKLKAFIATLQTNNPRFLDDGTAGLSPRQLQFLQQQLESEVSDNPVMDYNRSFNEAANLEKYLKNELPRLTGAHSLTGLLMGVRLFRPSTPVPNVRVDKGPEPEVRPGMIRGRFADPDDRRSKDMLRRLQLA